MYMWLTPYKVQKKAAAALLIASFIWLASSLFVEGFLCHDFISVCSDLVRPTPSSSPQPHTDQDQLTRWLYISTLDIVLELALILNSIYMIWQRQMHLRDKLVVIGAFACRAPNIAASITRLVFLAQPLTPANSAHWTSRVQATTQLAIGYTLTACVIPYLRPLMQAYEFPDGSTRGSSSGKSGSRFSKGSKGSAWSASKNASMNASTAGIYEGRATTQRMSMGPDLRDIGGLLERPESVLVGGLISEKHPGMEQKGKCDGEILPVAQDFAQNGEASERRTRQMSLVDRNDLFEEFSREYDATRMV
ncbi:hypothetical protein IQ07DRAFT_29344 [Pyrenochaeta sp. DS3sAY3a]|nr:hypothetical protein IQ07DRAFT_29344 [Pyrenochaeta sp. DS3sAY3a]